MNIAVYKSLPVYHILIHETQILSALIMDPEMILAACRLMRIFFTHQKNRDLIYIFRETKNFRENFHHVRIIK